IEGKRFKGHEEAAAALSVACDTGHSWFYHVLNSLRKVSAGALLMTLLAGTALGAWAIRQNEDHLLTKTVGVSVALPLSSPLLLPMPVIDQGMPAELQYHDIDTIAVKTYLHRRNSLLADEPYFSAIVESARKHDVHPLLLFAITGQEQGFVPKSHEKAKRIVNNPFNVFHSWEEYNTNIRDSADIAAKLLVKLGKNRPQGKEPFEWFNQTYAEDQSWSNGVRQLFQQLNNLSSAK
ncbi:MAG: glucosaminidase domain-containing protein, partial [Gorillibacterium sp.]|nr:glucosaminidase domain-containing protein [Gorillibacterium sp.]